MWRVVGAWWCGNNSIIIMDVDLLRSETARPSHNTVLWFEFLLDPSLLENHLQEETPGNVTVTLVTK
jgi:integrator complex subunit 8